MSPLSAAIRRACAVLALLVLVGGGGTAAHAHDVLIGSEPTAGAVLAEPPRSVVLSFNNPPLAVGSAITVVDATGTTVAEGQGTVEGTDVVLELGGPLPAGELEVRWRVASSDGHPIEGTIPFTVEGAGAPTATTDAVEPAPTAPVTPGEPAQEETFAGEDTASGLAGQPLWLRVAIGVAALGAVAGLIVMVVMRLRSDRL